MAFENTHLGLFRNFVVGHNEAMTLSFGKVCSNLVEVLCVRLRLQAILANKHKELPLSLDQSS